jgi:hypothetical protein
MDRITGTAAPGNLFDRAALPRDTRLELCLSLELAGPMQTGDAFAAAMLGHLVQALEAGGMHLGAATLRGLGRMRLIETEIRREGLGERNALLKLLAVRADAGEQG